MKTIDEILELATCNADLPSQEIIDALCDYEDEVRARLLAAEINLEKGLEL